MADELITPASGADGTRAERTLQSQQFGQGSGTTGPPVQGGDADTSSGEGS